MSDTNVLETTFRTPTALHYGRRTSRLIRLPHLVYGTIIGRFYQLAA